MIFFEILTTFFLSIEEFLFNLCDTFDNTEIFFSAIFPYHLKALVFRLLGVWPKGLTLHIFEFRRIGVVLHDLTQELGVTVIHFGPILVLHDHTFGVSLDRTPGRELDIFDLNEQFTLPLRFHCVGHDLFHVIPMIFVKCILLFFG